MRTRRAKNFAVMACGFYLALATWGAASVPAPEYVPTCGNAQDIAPMQAMGAGWANDRSPVVWNGKDYGAVWVDASDARLYFRRYYADGTPVGAATMLSSRASDATSAPDMVWTGSGYAIAWAALESPKNSIYMVRLDATGVLVPASETKVGGFGFGTQDSATPALAWNGSVYCCVFTYKFTPNVDHDIYGSIINASGTVTTLNRAIATIGQMQDYPTVAWFPAANAFQAAWDDYRSGTQYQIYGNQLAVAGTLGTERALVTPPAGKWARVSSLAAASNNTFIGLAWYDTRNTYGEVYFARYDQYEFMVGTEARLIPEATWNAYNPRLYWTGAEFGVVFEDFRGGNRDIWYQAITATGQADGTSRQVTFSSYMGDPAAAFARYGWLVTGHGSSITNFIQPVGCNYPYTPPCPENVMAYNVSGTQATLAWLPSPDPYTDIAYYQIYRNNALVAITDNTLYTDTGLTLSTTYNYAIRTVNAAQLVSSGCTATSSVYVKTNATLLLMVNKSAPNAALSWTDATMNNYNVFRGTDPRVMQQIGSTASLAFSDPNVLNDNVLYFYTVDEPGQ